GVLGKLCKVAPDAASVILSAAKDLHAGDPSPSARLRMTDLCRGSLEHVPDLQLEHPRRIDVRERGDGVRRRADRGELPERRIGRAGVAVGRLSTAEVVAVVEQVESLEAQQEGAAAEGETMLDERGDVVGRRAAEGGLAEDLPVDDGAVVVGAVAVVVDAGGG